jgi:hypothetical protein
MACDTQTLTTNASCFNCLDEHQLKAVRAYLLCQTLQPSLIIDDIALDVPVPINQAHGLGSTPRRVRFVGKVISALASYSIGDEIEGTAIECNLTNLPPFTWGANATNVWLVSDNTFGSGDDIVELKSGGSNYVNLSNTSVVGKLYIWR